MPMIVGNLFQKFYTTVDSVVVGRFIGEHTLVAIGVSYSLTTVFISIAIGDGVARLSSQPGILAHGHIEIIHRI